MRKAHEGERRLNTVRYHRGMWVVAFAVIVKTYMRSATAPLCRREEMFSSGNRFVLTIIDGTVYASGLTENRCSGYGTRTIRSWPQNVYPLPGNHVRFIYRRNGIRGRFLTEAVTRNTDTEKSKKNLTFSNRVSA